MFPRELYECKTLHRQAFPTHIPQQLSPQAIKLHQTVEIFLQARPWGLNLKGISANVMLLSIPGSDKCISAWQMRCHPQVSKLAT